jgi:hypothetical protein
MKRKILFFLLLVFAVSSYAQASYGSYTMFPNNKAWGSYYKPQLAFGKVNDQYLLVLCYTDPKAYASFDEESVMLLKFDDDSTVKLPISKSDEVMKKCESSWNSMKSRNTYYYKTFTSFDLDQNTIDKIVKQKMNIKKIRVSFTNGDIKDWDIDVKYQTKLIQGLNESYVIVESKDTVRKGNLNDVESGF